MAPPKRSAPARTAAAIAEDLGQARRVGGLLRATATDLTATMDFLKGISPAPKELLFEEARDLLLSHTLRVCKRYSLEHAHDPTAQAAANSLQVLLTREATSTRKALLVRQDAAARLRHAISADAVRHREDRFIEEIGAEVASDLQTRLDNGPMSLEAALRRLAPQVVDLRQQLHDGLVLTYRHIPPADARERRVIQGYYEQVVIKLGDLLVTCDELYEAGLRTPSRSSSDFYFINRAGQLRDRLFEEHDDRDYMRTFIPQNITEDWEVRVAQLLADDRGRQLFNRWIAWADSCYPTCAFERAWDSNYMCSPHGFVTLLYETEIAYLELGFTEPYIPENLPLLHHHVKG